MLKNKKGQFISKKMLSQQINKTLLDWSKQIKSKAKIAIRDKLEATFKEELLASYTPAKQNAITRYEHTDLLVNNVYAEIEDDTVRMRVVNRQYPNGRTTGEVYNYLKKGTPDEPGEGKGDHYYIYKAYRDRRRHKGYKVGMSEYISLEPHNFENKTRRRMKEYLGDCTNDLALGKIPTDWK